MTQTRRACAAALAAALCGACASTTDAPKAPETRWIPPAEAVPPVPTPAPLPPEASAEKLANRTVSLFEAIDVALKNSPVTRRSWQLAHAAAADVGSKQSAYYPSVEADFAAARQKVAAFGGSITNISTTYTPSVALNWLLLDLGGRGADVDEARRLLYAANFEHDAAMNDLMLAVAQAYYTTRGRAPSSSRRRRASSRRRRTGQRPRNGTAPASRRSRTSSRPGRSCRSRSSPTTRSAARSRLSAVSSRRLSASP